MKLRRAANQWILKHNMARKRLPKILRAMKYLYSVESISYSQNCEDLIFLQLIQGKKTEGLYVDIGAHHPIRFSNTYLLYTSGWHGINIDPLQGTKKLFDIYRPDDTNLEVGVSSNPGVVKYYSFNEPAYNTTSKEHARECIKNGWTKLLNIRNIKVVRLETIFDRYVGEVGHIDVMTIDVETRELDVLKSNNWEKYIPDWIIIEALQKVYSPLNEVNDDPVIAFLREKGYESVAKNKNAVFLEYRGIKK